MTRMPNKVWHEIPARLPEHGLHKLYKLPPEERSQRAKERSMRLVIPPLRKVLLELARAERPWPLYLWGPAGHGKTAAVLAFSDQVFGARYWDMDALIGQIRWDAPWTYYDVRLAVLDEVGSVRTGEGRNLDYEIVKRFFEWRQDRPAIYIGNQPPTQLLELYDRKILSRLSSGTQYKLVDRDRRLRS